MIKTFILKDENISIGIELMSVVSVVPDVPIRKVVDGKEVKISCCSVSLINGQNFSLVISATDFIIIVNQLNENT